MANNIQHAKDLSGLSIYRDKKGRAIYSDIITGNKGYIINDSDMLDYSRYELRLPIALCAFILIYLVIKLNIFICIAIGLAIYIVLSIMFYTKFLPSLTETTNFEKVKEGYFSKLLETKSKKSVIITVIICICLAVLSAINATKFTDMLKILNYGISVVAAVYAIMLIVAYLKHSKQDQK